MKVAGALSVALVFCALLSSPAAAAGASEANGDADKQVCRREQRVGTRLADLICLTKAQWKQRELARDEFKRRLKDSSESQVRERMMPGEPTGNGG